MRAAQNQSDEVLELRRNLHDGVLQVLEFMSSGGWGVLSSTEQYRELASHAAADLREAIECRALEGSLDYAIRRMSAIPLMLGPSINLVYDIDPSCELISAREYEPLVRAMRESVTNVVRHAKASRVVIRARFVDLGIELDVIDDGIGMCHDNRRGFGIQNSIVKRIQSAGGSVTISSPDIGGTCVRLSLAITN